MERVITCLVLCIATQAVAQNAASHAAPASPSTAQALLSPLQKQRDELQAAIVKQDAPRLAALIRTGLKLDFNFDDEVPRQRSSESPLTMAVNRNFPAIVRVLLDGGASASRLDGVGRAPIHLVKSAEVAGMLVKAGADANAPNYRGYSGLAEAVERGDLASVDVLIGAGAKFDAPSKNPDVFTLAAQARKAELIPALLERGADPRSPPTRALSLLIDAGDTQRAVMLIRRGADPDARNQFAPVLLVALFRKRWEIADALAEAGANLRFVDPTDCAGGYGCWSIQAARFASFEPPLVKRLAARGLDLNTVATNGHTALTSVIVDQPMAVRAISPSGAALDIPAPDNVARVRALLDAGADPNRKYRDMTPLMLAILRGGAFGDAVFAAGGRIEYRETIAQPDPSKGVAMPLDLAQRPVPMDSPALNYQGVNTGMQLGPLGWALMRQRADLALRQLERDRRLEPGDRDLLYFAAYFEEWDLVRGALRHKAEVNVADRADVTPLMLAAQAGRADAVRELLAAGARVNTRSARDWPPLTERNFKDEIGAAIAGHSHSQPKPRLVGGYTALRAAKERGHTEVARMLSAAGGRE